jgi:hypothetical protein
MEVLSLMSYKNLPDRAKMDYYPNGLMVDGPIQSTTSGAHCIGTAEVPFHDIFCKNVSLIGSTLTIGDITLQDDYEEELLEVSKGLKTKHKAKFEKEIKEDKTYDRFRIVTILGDNYGTVNEWYTGLHIDIDNHAGAETGADMFGLFVNAANYGTLGGNLYNIYSAGPDTLNVFEGDVLVSGTLTAAVIDAQTQIIVQDNIIEDDLYVGNNATISGNLYVEGIIDGYYTAAQLDGGQLDNRYYTEGEIDTTLSGKSDVGHTHDDRYYTETELDAGQLDNRYYTETELDAGQLDNRYYTETELDAGQLDNRYYTEAEVDALIALPTVSGEDHSLMANLDYASSGHTGFAPTVHTHDGRYYTETEMDTALSGKSNTGHTHDGRYYTETEVDTLIAGITVSGGDHSTLSNLDYASSGHTGFSPSGHTHDGRYYTETEMDTALSGKSDTGHNHDGRYYTESELDSGQLDNRYYTETELDNGQLDSRYYTESEMDTTLSGKSDTGHTHDGRYYTESELDSGQLDNRYYTESELDSGQLDNRYYTETEMDTALSGKSDTGHIHDDRYYTETEMDTTLSGKSDTGHTHDDRYYTETEMDTALSGKSDTGHTHDDRYYTETEIDTALSGKSDTSHDHDSEYVSLTANQSVGGNKTFTGTIVIQNDLTVSGTTTYINTQELNVGDNIVRLNANLSGTGPTENAGIQIERGTSTDANLIWDEAADKWVAGLVGSEVGISLEGHTHDDRYYTESEVDALISGTSAVGHNHDNRYYTESELDAGQLDNRYYTETEMDTTLSGKSDTGHTHDDRYYTETEMDTALSGKSDTGHTHDDRYYTETEMDTALGGKSDTGHTHDDRYYTESEVDALISGTAASNHNHDSRYYTETELNNGQLDNRYYTESELDSGQLDNRYYTESEMDTTLSGKSDTGHTHDDRYYTESEVDSLLLGVSVSGSDHSTLANLDYASSGHTGFAASGHTHSDYLNKDGSVALTADWGYGSSNISGSGDIYAAGFYGTSATGAVLELGEVGATDASYVEIYDGGSNKPGYIEFHSADGTSYYLATTNAGGLYLDTTVPSGSGVSVFITQATLDSALAGKSDTGHTHDDRYYTETEIDTLLAGITVSGGDHSTLSNLDYASSGHTGFAASGHTHDKIEEGNSSVEVVDAGTGYVTFVADGAEKARLNSTGLGIGTTPSYLLDVKGLAYFRDEIGIEAAPVAGYGIFARHYDSDTSGNRYAWYFDWRVSNASASSANNRGLAVDVRYEGGGNHTGQYIAGIQTFSQNTSSYTISEMRGIHNSVRISSGKTINVVKGSMNEIDLRGTVVNAYGAHNKISTIGTGVSVTNNITASYNVSSLTSTVTVPIVIGADNWVLTTAPATISDKAVCSWNHYQGNDSGATVGTVIGVWFDAHVQHSITNMYGFYMDDNITGAGTITNLYGLYIDDISDDATNAWGVWVAANVDNYFGGDVTVGNDLSVGNDLTVAKEFILSNPTVPATAGSTGTTGQVAWDSGYVYVCVATNTWKRAQITTWV